MRKLYVLPFLFLLNTPVLADGGCPIATVDKMLEAATAQVAADPDVTLVIYSGEEKDKLLKEINAVPPQTDYSAEKVVELNHPNDHYAIGLITGTCLTQIWSIPNPAWEAMRMRALGKRS